MIKEFDLLTVPLEGANLIEAGAGTGKTYSITGLYIRLLLEAELTVDRILVVTFTVAATEELKHRIRTKIIEAIKAMKTGRCHEDRTLEELTRKYTDRPSAIDKLERSLRQFDEAAIFTIHGFCSRMLNDYTFESNTSFNTEFISDQSSLLNRTVFDFWRKYVGGKSALFLNYLLGKDGDKLNTPDKLVKLAGKLYSRPFLKIIPETEFPDTLKLESNFLEDLEIVRIEWQTGRSQVEDILLNHESLHRAKYKQTSIPKWLASMDIALAAEPPSPAMFKEFEKFTAGILNSSLKGKNPDRIYHTFFEKCEQLNISRTSLVEAYDTTVLAIKSGIYRYIKNELSLKKKEANVQYYDDLLLAFYDSLNSSHGKHLTRMIRKRYQAALIDEFQDTDPLQYGIFKTIFKDEQCILFLIGDPKQAIYAFRGADIFAYLDAVNEVDNRYTLSVNWRSQPDFLSALNAIYEHIDRPFIYEDIPYLPARPAKPDSGKILKLSGVANPPLELWYLDSRNLGQHHIYRGMISKNSVLEFMAESVTAEISRLLTLADSNEALVETRHIKANDIAVLVRTNSEAAIIKNSLDKHNIPGILYSDKSVYATDEAIELLRIITAVAEPSRDGYIRAALSTTIFGYSSTDMFILNSDDDLWESILAEFRKLNELWREYGFMSMFRDLLTRYKIRSRILRYTGGERQLTNILHLGELIHGHSAQSNPGIPAIVKWYKNQISPDQPNSEDSQLRLESDDNAVKIVTIHKSKGLEYDIVFCPFAWGNSRVTRYRNVLFHDTDNNNELILDLGSESYEPNRSRAELEILAENTRLLYVALTRAKHRCYLGWGLFNTAGSSALAYTFHQPVLNDLNNIVDEVEAAFIGMDDNTALTALTGLTEHSMNSIDLKILPGQPAKTYKPIIESIRQLSPKTFTGKINRQWRISSFSNLSAGKSHHPDLPDYDSLSPGFDQPDMEKSKGDEKNIFTFPKGARAGTFCHELFENIDFRSIRDDYTIDLIVDRLKRYGFDTDWQGTIHGMIENTLNVSLSDHDSEFKLSGIDSSGKLNELEFHFPLNKISSNILNDFFTKHGQNSAETMTEANWRDLNFQPAEGFLKGFIDLVFVHRGRYYLLDWKSNHLGNDRQFYDRENISRAMIEHKYILQYHLYTVALHKYLSVRLENYDYERDFGGVYYLFLRGIDSSSRDGNGIFYDKPSSRTINELTSILIPGENNDE